MKNNPGRDVTPEGSPAPNWHTRVKFRRRAGALARTGEGSGALRCPRSLSLDQLPCFFSSSLKTEKVFKVVAWSRLARSSASSAGRNPAGFCGLPQKPLSFAPQTAPSPARPSARASPPRTAQFPEFCVPAGCW